MPRTDQAHSRSPVDILADKLGAEWPAIREARNTTRVWREKLEAAFDGEIAPDTSLVLFGSIARQEMTGGSDTDWILLVDGRELPSHKDTQHKIEKKLKRLGLSEPGKSGVFGCMVGMKPPQMPSTGWV